MKAVLSGVLIAVASLIALWGAMELARFFTEADSRRAAEVAKSVREAEARMKPIMEEHAASVVRLYRRTGRIPVEFRDHPEKFLSSFPVLCGELGVTPDADGPWGDACRAKIAELKVSE